MNYIRTIPSDLPSLISRIMTDRDTVYVHDNWLLCLLISSRIGNCMIETKDLQMLQKDGKVRDISHLITYKEEWNLYGKPFTGVFEAETLDEIYKLKSQLHPQTKFIVCVSSDLVSDPIPGYHLTYEDGYVRMKYRGTYIEETARYKLV